MKTVIKGLDHVLEWVTALTMAALVLDVLWQVATRFILKDPSSWTEELATYLLIWVGLLGSAVALKRGAHLGIDYFVGKLQPRQRQWTEVVVSLSVVGFAVSVLLIGGTQLVMDTFLLGQVSPALGLKLGYVYLAVPIAGFFITLYGIDFLRHTLAGLRPTGNTETG